mgnify:CR=1 FL=1
MDMVPLPMDPEDLPPPQDNPISDGDDDVDLLGEHTCLILVTALPWVYALLHGSRNLTEKLSSLPISALLILRRNSGSKSSPK